MPYPASFLRLVIMGTIGTDIWNTTLSLVPSGIGEAISLPVDQATGDNVRVLVEEWFGNALSSDGVGFLGTVKLTGIKLNRINASGHYQDPETIESVCAAPISGPSSSYRMAPQLATVATLRTAIPRGRGAMGRMYLPPNLSMVLGSDDLTLSTAQAADVAEGVAFLINSLNTHFGDFSGFIDYAKVGVASNAGAGKFEHVTHVTVGRVIDTMRSRRNKFTEDPQEAPVA